MLGLASAPGSVRVPVDYEATPGDNLKFEEKKEGKSGKLGRSGEMFEKVRLDPTLHTKAYRDLGSKSQASGNNGESAIGTDYPLQIVMLFGRDLGLGMGFKHLFRHIL
ncbi:hypothetical protein TWF506_000353 [Arthrobotrys conoides]|uniref:Uncharacterized protein n=1 Tax=Arthrobotrys conoides TaxID=74498 RepID=A0AAN8NKT2_9PEZI